MNVCKKCGYENPDGAKFCNECGSLLSQKKRPAEEVVKKIKPVEPDLVSDFIKPTPSPEDTVLENSSSVDEPVKIVLSEEDKLEQAARSLSTYTEAKEIEQEENEPEEEYVPGSVNDPFFDDVLPEIDNEIIRISKGTFVKIGLTVALVALMALYFLYIFA